MTEAATKNLLNSLRGRLAKNIIESTIDVDQFEDFEEERYIVLVCKLIHLESVVQFVNAWCLENGFRSRYQVENDDWCVKKEFRDRCDCPDPCGDAECLCIELIQDDEDPCILPGCACYNDTHAQYTGEN